MEQTLWEIIPFDVLFEITTHLDLADILSFLLVCPSFRKLSASRYLWIDVLERTQKHRRLACPVGLDITTLEIDQLQRVAHLTHRVRTNWSKQSPRIFGATKSVPYVRPSEAEPAAILVAIQGTPLVVLYTQENTERLICCDMASTSPNPRASMHVGTISRRAHYDEFGRHIIALVTRGDRISLRVIAMTYGERSAPEMKELFSSYLDVPCRALFICRDVIGVVPFAVDDSALFSIRAFNYNTGISFNIFVDLGYQIYNTSYVFCSVFDDTPYVITVEDKDYCIHKVPWELLPHGSKTCSIEDGGSVEGNLTLVAEISRAGVEDSFYVETAELRWSPRGLHGIFVQYTSSYTDTTCTLVRSWPRDLPPSSHNEMTMDGRVSSYSQSRVSPWLVGSSPSGTYSAAIINCSEVEETSSRVCSGLCLLEYSCDPPGVQCRQLTLPFYIDLDQIYSIALDERCGVIYISHVLGHLFAIPYA
ncbi:hypothetical protein BDZ94DRAFT_307279 [Collybia nuda]|uniref:F-box domain-containing protein n=1 Tax=Collybia nuda TaxID=64659 RepID=A0A9P5YBP6_9AGAR|nr:hypothetical protein BDZ94DRAFT_307279 [Collybia nuda]